jgi:uncharacterized protein (TIGR02466 family)
MTFDEPEVRVLFPVPLVTFRIDDAATLNQRLIEEIRQRRAAEPGIDRSNRHGWHSATDFFDRAEPAHAELAREIEAMVAAATAKLIPDMPAGLRTVHEGWVNVSPTHAMNAPHDHPGSFWSGTYYVQVPDADGEDRRAGAIEFLDPRGSIGANANFETAFTRSKFTARPAAGSCLIWPSFVKHWVHPNRSAQHRISVAFNSHFTRAAK